MSCSKVSLEDFTTPLSATKHDASLGKTLHDSYGNLTTTITSLVHLRRTVYVNPGAGALGATLRTMTPTLTTTDTGRENAQRRAPATHRWNVVVTCLSTFTRRAHVASLVLSCYHGLHVVVCCCFSHSAAKGNKKRKYGSSLPPPHAARTEEYN